MKSLPMTKPHLIVVIGMPGVGKSTFAEKFAQTFNAPYVDYVELHELAGGDDAMAEKIVNYVLGQLTLARQTIVIDGPGDRAADRKEIMNFAQKHNYLPLFVWVQTEPATAESRAVHSRTATMTKSQFDARMEEFENPTAKEPVLVISGKHTYVSQARSVLKRLAQDRPSVPAKPEPPRTPHVRGRITR